MTEIVIATFNSGKAAEIAAVMTETRVRFSSLSERDNVTPVEENGTTFEDNAIAKARGYAAVLGLPCLADDSGLEVDAIDRAPGINSARFAGTPTDDDANNRKLLDLLRHVPDIDRGARFVCVAALAFPDGLIRLARGECSGVILHEPRGTGGFGYDPLFLPAGYDQTFAELEPELKNRISHRAKAMARMNGIIGIVTDDKRVRRITVTDGNTEPRTIELAADCVRAGGIVAAPTDTIYGLLADATRADSARAVAETKGRPDGKPILALASDIAMAGTVAVIDQPARRVVDALWPGAVTLVLQARPGLPAELLGPAGTVAVRVPDDDLPRATAAAAGVPLTGTSANRSGQGGAGTAAEVAATFGSHIDLLIDAGPARQTKPSTLLDARRWPPVLLRQ
ncbi:MAG: RdgB/HAM1 family non-canonical purine NTP pyrophosphatase [Candidatus Hydrogenedentes bacterium]|nr:RdgB/HAM1 family non-canonical purine NTP pyrophosphatase [Candidatus Hydrogenedentota bacterium]